MPAHTQYTGIAPTAWWGVPAYGVPAWPVRARDRLVHGYRSLATGLTPMAVAMWAARREASSRARRGWTMGTSDFL
jgi:hypothetical protein